MPIGNILSNAGLFSQGMKQSELDQQNIEQQKQRTSEGAIKLGDIQRADTEQAGQRTAVQQAGPSLHDIAMAKAEAAKQAGNDAVFQKYAAEAMQIPQQTTQMIAESAVRGLSPDQIEANAERLMGPGQMFDKGSLRIERRADGHVIVNGTKDGVDHPALDATALYAQMAPKVKLGAGETLVSSMPGSPSIAANPKAGHTASNATFIESGGGDQTGKIVTPGSPTTRVSSSTITRTGGTPTGTTPKDLPALKAIQDAVLKSPGMGTIDPKTGQLVGNQPAQEKAADAQSIYLNDRTMPPAEAANAVKFGKRATGPSGEKAYFYNGKMYKLAPTGQQFTPQAPQQMTPEDAIDENADVNESNYSRGGKVNPKGLG